MTFSDCWPVGTKSIQQYSASPGYMFCIHSYKVINHNINCTRRLMAFLYLCAIIYLYSKVPNFMTYGIRRFSAAFTGVLGSPVIAILSRINPIPRIDTYFFKINSNIVLSSPPRLSWRQLSCSLPINILKAFLHSSILATWPAHLKHSNVAVRSVRPGGFYELMHWLRITLVNWRKTSWRGRGELFRQLLEEAAA